MRQSRRLRLVAVFSPVILLGSWLVAGGEIGHATPPDRTTGAAASPHRTTIEPLPGLDLTVDLDSLQKGSKGAVAGLVLKVATDLEVTDAVVSARAPADLVFADGSKAKSWKVKPASGRAEAIRVEVIASRDGLFNVSFELEGTVGGKTLHRGVAYPLQVGEGPKTSVVRHGAIEYPAVQEGGVQP